MTAEPIPCSASFQDAVATPHGVLDVYRCDWGWYVRNGERGVRSRFLDEAFESALGRPLDHGSLRALVEMLDRELMAKRDGTDTAVSELRL